STTCVEMPCAWRAVFSALAALRKALLVMMRRFAAFVDAFHVDGSFQAIAAGASTRLSANAKIVRVPEPVVANETDFVPSLALPELGFVTVSACVAGIGKSTGPKKFERSPLFVSAVKKIVRSTRSNVYGKLAVEGVPLLPRPPVDFTRAAEPFFAVM